GGRLLSGASPSSLLGADIPPLLLALAIARLTVRDPRHALQMLPASTTPACRHIRWPVLRPFTSNPDTRPKDTRRIASRNRLLQSPQCFRWRGAFTPIDTLQKTDRGKKLRALIRRNAIQRLHWFGRHRHL